MSFLEIVLENRDKGGKRKPFKKSSHTKESLLKVIAKAGGQKNKS